MPRDYQPFELEHLIEDALTMGVSEERIIEILANQLNQVAMNRAYQCIESEMEDDDNDR